MAAAYACNQQAAASASMAHGARARPCRLGVVAQVRAMLTPKAADEQQPIVVGCSTDNWNTDSWNTDSSLGLLERLEPPRAAGLPAACTRRDGDATLSSHAAIAPRNSPMKSSPSAPTKVESWLARPVISRSLYETQATATGPGAYTYARKHPAKAAPAPRPWTQRRARPPLKFASVSVFEKHVSVKCG